eukprot:1895897-Alexandrium_andersonii.AAC.1
MSASLVGSEMCIRDRAGGNWLDQVRAWAASRAAGIATEVRWVSWTKKTRPPRASMRSKHREPLA